MVLEAKTREVLGKKVNALRREGLVPGEMYGRGTENMHVAVPEKAFAKVWKEAGENTVVSLKLAPPAGGEFPVLIGDVSLDHITGRPLTVDFRRVQKGEKMTVHVPVVLKGESPAEKEGLTVMQTLQEVEVESLPENIPHEFAVDVSSLAEAGQSISVKDLPAMKNAEILTDEHTVIVTVAEKQKEEEVAPPPAPEEGAAPEAAPAESATEEKSPEKNP